APNANYHGIDSFSYTVSDAHGATSIAMVTVTIAPVNDSPVAANDFATCSKNGSVNVAVLANDSDVDGDTLSVSGIGRPISGSVALNADGSIRYRAKKGFTGTDSFTYTVIDGNGGNSTATVTVSVVH
ncbi:MAG TPA: tandem-95 repeat protein, partial [Thermoanaerobaculia bacterium]